MDKSFFDDSATSSNQEILFIPTELFDQLEEAVIATDLSLLECSPRVETIKKLCGKALQAKLKHSRKNKLYQNYVRLFRN